METAENGQQERQMKYEIYGPFPVTRNDTNNHIDKASLNAFWKGIDSQKIGLSEAIGCYVFSISAGRGELPWYVGKTSNAFCSECFQDHKLVHYNGVLAGRDRGIPHMTLIARVTETGRFSSATTGIDDIDFLEKYLIGVALERNPGLVNIKETSMLRDIYVPGILNPQPGSPGEPARRLKHILKID